MNFSCQAGEIPVDGVSVLCMVDEPHRIVLVTTSLLVPAGSGLLFRECCWMIMSEDASSSASSPRTLFQTCYRIHEVKSETAGTADTTHARTTYLREFILQAQSEKMRAVQLLIQNLLVQELDSTQGGSLLDFSRLFIECSAC